MILLIRIGLFVAATVLIFISGYLMGRQHARVTTLKTAIAAYQLREKINADVQNMDDIALCRALSGLSNNECATLMRRDE